MNPRSKKKPLHIPKTHKPWDGTEVPGSFGLVLPGEPNLQQLLGPLEEVCTVLFHRETTDTEQKIQNVGNVSRLNYFLPQSV